jgi:DMSO/TMAO reductase YedYZ molybdopterin-dependent catalytic subunit
VRIDTTQHRRDLIRTLAAGAFTLATGRAQARPSGPAREPELIIRNTRPLDAESPVEVFDRFLTPNHLFFIRSHFGAPAVGLSPWRLELDGEVNTPLSLNLQDLDTLQQATVPAVLQCSGNGRAFFEPRIPGVGWERGAVGNAEWAGVRLKDLLGRAGVKDAAAHVHLLGADGPPNPKTPRFFRSIPLARALADDTLVAVRMNGEPLPTFHGGPMRLVVPGWSGNHWMKWLRRITVSRVEAPGFFMQTGYRMPKEPLPPGVDPKPGDLLPLTALNVKSLIARPSRDEKLPPGRHEVRGVAWTGDGVVTSVEVRVDDGPWLPATLDGPARAGTWRLWRFAWDARQPGRHDLRVRATDSLGRTQPETTPWNRSGYLWNGIDHVTCEVA